MLVLVAARHTAVITLANKYRQSPLVATTKYIIAPFLGVPAYQQPAQSRSRPCSASRFTIRQSRVASLSIVTCCFVGFLHRPVSVTRVLPRGSCSLCISVCAPMPEQFQLMLNYSVSALSPGARNPPDDVAVSLLVAAGSQAAHMYPVTPLDCNARKFQGLSLFVLCQPCHSLSFCQRTFLTPVQ